MKKTISFILVILLTFSTLTQYIYAKDDSDYEVEEICPYRFLILLPEEERLLANCLFCETGSFEWAGKGDAEEGRRCCIANCQVMLNRYMSERWMGDSKRIERIICDGTQFHTYDELKYVEAPDYIYDVMYSTLMGEDLQIGYDVYFFSQGLNKGTEFVCKIGRHIYAR